MKIFKALWATIDVIIAIPILILMVILLVFVNVIMWLAKKLSWEEKK